MFMMWERSVLGKRERELVTRMTFRGYMDTRQSTSQKLMENVAELEEDQASMLMRIQTQ